MEHFNFYHLKKLLFAFICLFLISSCSQDILEQEEIEAVDLVTGNTDDSKIIKDQYVILLSEKPGKRDRRASENLEAIVAEVRATQGAQLRGIYKHSITGFAAKLTPSQVEKYRRDPRILSITPDRIIELENVEETSALAVQDYPTWGLDRIDQRELLLDRAYSFTATGSGVNAYIMDSGIRYSHDEFEGRATLGVDLVRLYPDEEYDVDDPDIEDGADCNGHGTHVAGTAGGSTYGVAKAVNLISVRVFSCRGITSYSRVIQGVEWVTENAVKPAVVNMSIGGATYEPLDVAIENSIATGINYALSAGNSDSDACEYSPARAPSAITVGASMIDNQRSNFSNYGECLDLYAPGSNIVSASHIDDSSVRELNGTSMAAPHVAGLTALYLERNTNATPEQVHTAVIENATKDVIQNVPSGTTSLAHSLWETVNFTPPASPDLNLKAYGFKEKGSTTIHLTWEPTEDPFVSIYRNGSYFARWYNDGRYKLSTNGKGNDVFKVCEINYNNCSADAVANFDDTGDFEPNKSPVPSFTYLVDGLQVQFTDTSTDEDGTIIAWTWYFGDGSSSGSQHPLKTYSEPGTYRIELMVQDNYHDLQYIIDYIEVGNVNENLAPIADFSYTTTDLAVQFKDLSTDSDGSISVWNWDFGDGNTSSSTNPLHVYTNPGNYIVGLLVTDNDGETSTVSREITVDYEEPAPGGITLSANGYKTKGQWNTDLSWSPAGTSAKVDVYRNDNFLININNIGNYTDATTFKGGGSLTYKVCEAGTSNCSNEVTVQF